MKLSIKLSLFTLMLIFSAHFAADAQVRSVILHEGDQQNGYSKKYSAGNWYLGGGENFDNRASSITVPDGYSAAVCDNSSNPAFITGGKTPDGCVRFPEGKYRFQSLDKKATYMVVEQFEDRRRDCVVCLYSGQVGKGYVKRFNEAGTFPVAEFIGYRKDLDGNNAPTLGDTASSIWIALGYTVVIKALGVPKTYEAGLANLPAGLNNHISEIIIKKKLASGADSPKPKPKPPAKSPPIQTVSP